MNKNALELNHDTDIDKAIRFRNSYPEILYLMLDDSFTDQEIREIYFSFFNVEEKQNPPR